MSELHGIRPPAYRLPDASRVASVRLQVSDLARSLAYYEGVLGFRVLGRSGAEAALGAAEGGEALVELVERADARPAPAARLGLFHFAILLPDRAALGRFAAQLAAQGVRPGASDHLVSEALYLADPDGLGIEVYADRPRAEWRYRGPELRMTTLPLDLGALAREGGGEPWSGMPAGTRIGHVHLHVGGLAEAAAFYHAALGMDRVVWSYPGALFLSAGGYHHHLGLNTWAGPRARPAADVEPRLLEWRLALPSAADAAEAAASLDAAGYGVARDGGGWTAADPWGTAVRVEGAPPGAAPSG